ncbi:hypothetical protein [uncultured Selenomonas sp.]|jgi:hypothetical protein|uniref:hypothetical protein n=1 Tax=uncultured Selenomonas sp. TaxID=159275 RepID=UPI0025F2477D|nr:hypothetical protein [uncultured Selenomonas sp.]
MVVSVDLNERDAQAVASYAERKGLSLSEMLAQIVREYTAMDDGATETMRAVDDVNHHRNLSRSFSSVEELMEELNA